MPYAIPNGSILECQIRGKLDAQVMVNTFHYKLETSVVDGHAAAVAFLADFETLVWAKIRPGLSNELMNVVLTAQWVHPQRYVIVTRTPANPAGALASPATPSGVAVVVRRTTEKAGRKYRGRIYIPGIPSGSVDASLVAPIWYATYFTGLEQAMTAALSGPLAELASGVIWSYRRPGEWTYIIAAAVDTVLRYQRRREIGKGE